MEEDARVKRLYALAERLGRLSGEAHNLIDELAARLVEARASTRPTDPAKSRRPPRPKKA